MRALVSTDLHSSPRATEAIGRALAEGSYDAHICLGDIITFRPMAYLEDLMADPPVRTLTLPGNTDSDEARARLEELGHDIHFRRVEVAGVTIAGAGGCPPPPFRTAFVVEEEEYTSRLPGILEGADVLALHAPARGVLDRTAFGMRVGAKGIRAALERSPPKAVLSGHIHEARGIVLWDWEASKAVERDGRAMTVEVGDRTLFMNPGPARDGLLGVLELEGDRVEASITRW